MAGMALVAAAMLAACGRGDVATPPPLALGPPPDTAVLGAGPSRSRSLPATPGRCAPRAEEALQRINAARAAGRRCGSRAMPAAGPLRWNDQLQAAADGHSVDMARRNYFEHRSPEGVDVSERVAERRYKWKSVGENLAGGNRSIEEAVDAWLGSPPHCENLMDAKYVDVGVSCVAQAGTAYGTYWTMVLGRK